MTKTPRPPSLTAPQLAILRVLWREGPLSVRDVQAILDRSKPTGYTTVLKIMQIMAGKGLVRRDETQRSHVYHAARSEEQTQRQALGHILERVFGGSAQKLVMQALSSRKASRAELAEIRKLLDQIEEQSP